MAGKNLQECSKGCWIKHKYTFITQYYIHKDDTMVSTKKISDSKLIGIKKISKMRTNYYNLFLDNLDTIEVISKCEQILLDNNKATVYFINAHCFNIAQKNKEYLRAIHKADIVLNDGVGIDIGARLAKISLKENMNGTDLIPKIIEISEKKNEGVFLLGAKKDVVDIARKNLIKKHPKLPKIAINDGYFSPDQNQAIINKINQSNASVLIVGMGVPIQELWLEKNMSQLKNIKLGIAGGAIIDFISGKINRAPFWMICLKIEWLYRLIKEPKRLWKRYLIGNFIFFFNIFKHKTQKMLNNS